jgi:hypothetical protein
MSLGRIVAAFIVAPVVPSLLTGAYFLATQWGLLPPLTPSRLADPALTAISYGVAVLVDIPAFICFRRALNKGWWRYVALGSVMGCLPALLFLAYDAAQGFGFSLGLIGILIGAGYGAVAGLAFWLIGIARARDSTLERTKDD